jgi:hypothetical protein
MKTYREPNNLSGTHIRRCICLLLTSFFFLGVVALAMHHHDAFFPLKNCTICKAKTSFSSVLNKIKADPPITMVTVNQCSEEIYFTFPGIKFYYQAPFIASLLPNPFLNKAPPFVS